ncbi:hypothetical protein GGI25_000328 [Coemansia spiralis]|uniref:t-SNARE coiled-coil homology domain-containing protein n=2 Tax=Coemansia TaxID=4863 RepID=A0A9W8GEP9_9FUNG|nr:hypothetical protein BX070DRAFT_233323 [Coemansia spiralis]KAJ1996265.1 hypothetical protein EDC05_000155 [Coemansia umbellata]KAJ2625977.1 hypothetical protein GGI26_000061 [Coemansia sp. RSA 1358]KAJ2680693.1 hypothetical protein GGI25_000328 [Coemansia spiralis]
MDITSEFKQLVRKHASLATSEKSKKRTDILPPSRKNFTHPNNAFLSEAYIIAKHIAALHSRIIGLRPAYLNLQRKSNRSTSPMQLPGTAKYTGTTKLSDPERDEIDRGIKTTIRQMLHRIQSLNELGENTIEAMDDDRTESIDVLFQRLVSALDPRKAGIRKTSLQTLSKRDSLAALHSSVVWWLNARLQAANQVHGEMQELYLRQKLERQHTVLSQQKQKSQLATTSNSPAANKDDEILKSLSEHELQQLQIENANMVNEFEDALDRIRETQKSVVEISTLQTQLASELNAQMQLTERLYDEAVGAVDDVGQGNEYLVSARKHQSDARKWVLMIFIVLSLVLLFLDWFD